MRSGAMAWCRRCERVASVAYRPGRNPPCWPGRFVIGVNTTGRRDSMTVQIAAASSALVLGAGLRKDGRWIRNTHSGSSSSMDAAITKAVSQCGLILDILGPDALREVRDGAATLNRRCERRQTSPVVPMRRGRFRRSA